MDRKKTSSKVKNTATEAPEPQKGTTDQTASEDSFSSKRPCLVVGIGASSRGQASLEQIFTSMPTDCGLAFVVIMHLHPEGPSYLPEILGRCTSMPVLTAEDGMSLQSNTIHVIPSGMDLTVGEGLVRLEPAERAHGVHHPIDRFFQSLAADAAERGVAVLLSGYGIDGTAGIKAVREAGGAVLVQEPASTFNPDMPRSAIVTGVADFVLSVEEITAKIAEIARGSCVLQHRSCRVNTLDDELAAIFGIVRAGTGHDFSDYKTSTIIRRIERRMAVNDVSGIRKYVTLLEENPREAHALCQDILIGVTGFFRDPEAFKMVDLEIIPRLFADRDSEDPVRIWHACCATGEEVYSMAFLIREFLDRQGSNARVQIFATDIDETSIAQARAGLYPEGIEEEVGEDRLKAFFIRNNKRWQVVKQVRDMIVFAHHSLIKNPPFSRLDLLVCRNFLIYLNPDMQKRLISLFHQVLRPGRFLFLGSSETVGRSADLFTPVDKKWKLFERKEGKRHGNTMFPLTTPVRYLPGTARIPKLAEALEKGPVAVVERLLMERYAPPCVVVNEKYEVVHVTTRMNRFLEVPLGEPSREILRMARVELRPALRTAIHKAFAENRRVDFRGLKIVIDELETTVNLLVEPLETAQASGKLAMVVFEPISTPAPMVVPAGEEEPPGNETTREMLVRQLEEHLRITHEQLQATTEQLEISNAGFLSANEELISMNEEFQTANEELQSTNEELETSKEELQALNEELITVNSELQGKVEELNQATSDMENLFASSGVATLFLDRTLNIKSFTPAAAAIFNLIFSDIGRPFRHLAGKIDWLTLTQDAETVLAGQPCAEEEVASLDSEQCYLKRIFPYRTQEGRIDGIVINFIDITERKRMEEQTGHLASFPQLNPNPVLEVDSTGLVIFSNPATRKILDALGMDSTNVEVFLPADLDQILREWDRESETTLYREINVGDRIFAESIFLTPQFDVARIYAFDITERKRAQEALAESEGRIRRKLESIIAPEGDIGSLDLADIIDAPSLQALVNDFYQLTGMPMGLIDLNGKVLAGVGWQAICTQFHRINPVTCKNCIESDTLLSAGVPHGAYKVYKCKNNMWDVATPVMVGDKQFGNLFMGQFFFDEEPLDYELFRSQARKYGFDEKEYITALEAVPRLSRETLDTSMHFFMKLADILSKQSYSNLKLARSLAEQESLMESLAESELFYRQTLESIPGMVFTTRPDGYCDYQSQQWVDFTGVPMSEHVGDGWNKLLHPDDRPRAYAAWFAAVEERASYDLEYRVRRHDGEYEWFKVRGRPIRNEAGEIVRWFGTAVNIDQMLKTQEVLRQQEERLRLAMAASRMASWDWNVLSGEVVWNDAHYRMMGYEPGEVRPSYEAWAGRLHPDDREATEKLIQQCMIEKRIYIAEFRTLWPDGTIRWLEARGDYEYDANNQPLRNYGVMLDITERKQTEEQLSDIRADLARAQEVGGIGSWRLNVGRNELTWSDETYHIFGIPKGTPLSYESFLDHIHPDDRMYVDTQWMAALGGEPYDIEHRIVVDGKVKWVREKAFLELEGPDNLLGGFGIVQDITQRKEVEEELRKAHDELEMRVIKRTEELAESLENQRQEMIEREKTEVLLHQETLDRLHAVEALREKEQMLIQQSRQAAMGEMIGNIAHQWRQPLNALGLFTQRIGLFYDTPNFSKEFLDTSITKSMEIIQHMSKTIDDFSDYFKPDKEKTDFRVGDAIKNTLSLLEGSFQHPKIRITIETKDNPVINGFQNEFAQVLLNILINARDAIVEREIVDAEVAITISNEEGRAIVTISDNAGGIPEAIIDKVFDPYFTTKGPQKGTGVGLFMSKSIIEKNMGGKLTVRNTDTGAEFRIEV